MNILPQKFFFFFNLQAGIVWLAWFMMLLNIPIVVLMLVIIAQRNNIFMDHSKLGSIVIPLCIVETGSAFIQIFTNIFLINGVIKESHWDMLPWLVINKITIGLFFLTAILIGVNIGLQLPIFIYIIMGFIAAILIYSWLCVFSLFKTYKSWSNNDTPQMDDLERILLDNDDEMLQ